MNKNKIPFALRKHSEKEDIKQRLEQIENDKITYEAATNTGRFRNNDNADENNNE